MKFKKIPRGVMDFNASPDTVYLEIDNWNDYSFVTVFRMRYRDISGVVVDIGIVKIGFKGQTIDKSTHSILPWEFNFIGDEYFSLGQSVEFYRNLGNLAEGVGRNILAGLRDVVFYPEIIDNIKNERVFGVSLLREISLSLVKGQFSRAFAGVAELTNFNFRFVREESETQGGVSLDFSVSVESTPGTNIHAIIGRNGVGKTTLLNGMIDAITKQPNSSKFINLQSASASKISADYFSSLVSVSFSAFDPFNPPKEQPNQAKGTCYFYIGLKDVDFPDCHLTISALRIDCAKSLAGCFRNERKTKRWMTAIEKLGSDKNFAAMNLSQLHSAYEFVLNDRKGEQSDSDDFIKQYARDIDRFLSRMSSGHAIVLLTITRLVDTVQEKTLVLLDEPESHLHPPLLSAFIRALSDLLYEQNGVAIIATHSPVVLQEIPKLCVWKIYRLGKNVSIERPIIETFAESVSLLTSEVFGLEVTQSGFHSLLDKSVKEGASFGEILNKYNNQIGFEGRSILAALIAEREAGAKK